MMRLFSVVAVLFLVVGCNRKPVEVSPAPEEETQPEQRPRSTDPLLGRDAAYWIKLLGDEHQGEQAVRNLAKAGPPTIPPLLEAMQNPDAKISANAQRALEKMGAAAAPALTEALSNDALADRMVLCLVQIGPDAAPGLVAALESKDARVRGRAARALGGQAAASAGPIGKVATKPLLALLKDDDENVRAAALAALAPLPLAADAVAPLRAALTEKNTASRAAAATALGTLGPDAQDAGPDLVQLLQKDDQEPVRLAAVGALGKMKSVPGGVSALAGAVKGDASAKVRAGAAATLGTLAVEPKDAVPALTAAASNDKELPVRVAAAAALGEYGSDAAPAVLVLVKALQEKEAELRTAAIAALVKIGEPARPELARAVKNSNADVRLAAVKAVADVGGDLAATAMPGIAEGLKAREPGVRREAVESLKLFGAAAKPAVPALTTALKDEDEQVREKAIDCLSRIGAPATAALVGALKNDDPRVRDKATVAIAELAPDAVDAVPALSGMVENEKDMGARLGAVDALTKFGPAAKPALKPLLALLRGTDDRLRQKAQKALVAIGPDAVPGLMELFRDKEVRANSTAHSYVTGALTKIGKPAVADLAAALKDSEVFVRVGAANTLKAIGPDAGGAEDALTEASKDANKDVSRAASEALKKIKK